ncbi:hypothetical protein [Candidatus Coxiella mudrowiae]|nr:hypothetical protein [Candidatus Coxiella mudrowiae]
MKFVFLMGDNNQLVAERTVGSIQFKGLSAMQGYCRNNQETQAAFHQGC